MNSPSTTPKNPLVSRVYQYSAMIKIHLEILGVIV